MGKVTILDKQAQAPAILFFGNDWFAENRTSSHQIARWLAKDQGFLLGLDLATQGKPHFPSLPATQFGPDEDGNRASLPKSPFQRLRPG